MRCAVGYPFCRNRRLCLLSCSGTLFYLMAALRCLHVWLYNVMIFFNWGFWGFVLSFSSVLPLEQAFQEAQRSRERFSPGNQEAIGCLGTHTAVLGQTPSPSSCLKGPAWGCSLCMLLREPPVPCELLEERMVHARGAVATMRHGAEGREASHTPAKQSGGWASTLGQMGEHPGADGSERGGKSQCKGDCQL